jgi:hypothetical protein
VGFLQQQGFATPHTPPNAFRDTVRPN